MKKTLMIICAVLVLSMAMSQPAKALEVPLIAGQDMPVGHVTVEVIDDGGVPTLRVEYLLDEVLYEGCETGDFLEFKGIHLHVATTPGDIPQNNKGLPQIGHFMYNDNPTLIPLTEIPAVPGDTIYIAAHAGVGSDSEFCGICDDLVIETVEELVIDYVEDDGNSYFEITIGEGEEAVTYPVWCVDIDHSMSLSIGESAYPITLLNADLYAATCVPELYDPFPTELGSGYGPDGGIDRPENLPAVGWILNQWRLRTSPLTDDWNVPDIQRVVWHLMEGIIPGVPPAPDVPEVQLQNAIQEAILASVPAELPEPDCCDYVGVIIAPSVDLLPDALDIDLRQLAILLVPAPCCIDETAWALDPDTGTLFAPLKNDKRICSWAEYFSFLIPGGG